MRKGCHCYYDDMLSQPQQVMRWDQSMRPGVMNHRRYNWRMNDLMSEIGTEGVVVVVIVIADEMDAVRGKQWVAQTHAYPWGQQEDTQTPGSLIESGTSKTDEAINQEYENWIEH